MAGHGTIFSSWSSAWASHHHSHRRGLHPKETAAPGVRITPHVHAYTICPPSADRLTEASCLRSKSPAAARRRAGRRRAQRPTSTGKLQSSVAGEVVPVAETRLLHRSWRVRASVHSGADAVVLLSAADPWPCSPRDRITRPSPCPSPCPRCRLDLPGLCPRCPLHSEARGVPDPLPCPGRCASYIGRA